MPSKIRGMTARTRRIITLVVLASLIAAPLINAALAL